MGLTRDHHRFSKRITSTTRWQVLRQAILERDGWACRACGTRRGRLEVDHIRPVRTDPARAYDPANLQTLCAACHTRKTRIECGHRPALSTPDLRAWGKAVAELATTTPAK